MIPPSDRPTRDRPAPIALRHVRPVARAPRRSPARTEVHPVYAELVRTRPGHTDARIDGRPIRVYIERDRLHWPKLIGLVAAIMTPIVGAILAIVYAVGTVVRWGATHWIFLTGAALALVLTVFILGRVGGCPGIHCPGCGHR